MESEKPKIDYSKYVNQHKNIKIQCETCLGEYTYYNKTHHHKSKKHLNAQMIRNQYL